MAQIEYQTSSFRIETTSFDLKGGFFILNNKDFPIVPDIGAEIKFWGPIFLKDVLFLGVFILGWFMCVDQFPIEQTKQKNLFTVLTVILAIYLDMRPLTNPGKRNFEVIKMMILNRSAKMFKSFGYYEFTPLNQFKRSNR